MSNPSSTSSVVTAAMLAIGDELLSGRTKDKNIGHLADVLTMSGIDLKEVRIVADEEESIVEALNALRSRYDYVFTSGGIGPTHDDITADAISAAFGLPCEHDAEALRLLGDMYRVREMEFTEARKRMARMPKGAAHIANPVSVAPGFVIGNVYVMAGVPQVFQAMLDNVMPTLRTGAKVMSQAVRSPYGEGDIGTPLTAIQKAHPETSIGSYPKYDGQRFSTEIVVRARDAGLLKAATEAVAAMIEAIGQEKQLAASKGDATA
ncbi:molybdenum cofactor biosynthesis protein [Agrobacterium tumefaciens]|jgi:molybdenum cofactor synthesis domain-containing protein|uniref:Molybdenum cofactor biosynthesis protein n=1 Tax=Agrobacterium fabrum (strain C58 / ATCC 33970) TaxID=176299 RepID=Q7CYN5_AGRFC|nr:MULTISPECIES: competence/damage-inducible protein A [Agrobacterium]KEY50504.1 molybdenum cofactor biosynthesis protein [Agrobacterium tumefaciens]AAK87500.2 putative molybdenum cofactor biosynthesis protein [Agrobacterium fabrum str. C58]AYM57447.1 molybdenum cofactor biosynthesis protein [Agrobacterium fabrum]AYM62501.1 molybdenum cofactor biosynthesis protein [Agrobacterium fabrum]EGL63732.1 putative molybdenum cofactor biosynthesis protein [Agrobacterium sp. ATCC 31749]